MKRKLNIDLNKKSYKWIAFVLCFLLATVYSLWKNAYIYQYDAEYYWNVGKEMLSGEGINFLHFPETCRGYFFPLIVSLLRVLGENILGSEIWAWRIYSNIVISALFTFILPLLLTNKSISDLKTALRTNLAFIMTLFFWGDYLQYPLSDITACTFLCAGVALLKYIASLSDNEMYKK